MKTNPATKGQTKGIWAKPQVLQDIGYKGDVIIKGKIAAKHSTQCMTVVNRTKRGWLLCAIEVLKNKSK